MDQRIVDTDLGPVTLVAQGGELTGVHLRRRRTVPEGVVVGTERGAADSAVLVAAAAQLQDYLAGRRRGFDLPVRAEGDEFQRRVRDALAQVPYGEITTYGRLAAELGDRRLAQQVGRALAANPVCVVVPCHRVIGADGSLTGYAGGLRRKQQLLDLEQHRDAERLF